VTPLALWAVVQDTLGVISKEIRERVSEETLRYCRIALGMAEPEERKSLNLVEFNDEGFYRLSEEPNIDLCHDILVSRERDPQQSRHLLFYRKRVLGRCKSSLSG